MKQWEDFVHLPLQMEGENFGYFLASISQLYFLEQFPLQFIHLAPATSLRLQISAFLSAREHTMELRCIGHFLP